MAIVRWDELLSALEADLAQEDEGDRDDAAWGVFAAHVRRLSDVLVRQFGTDGALDGEDVAQDVLVRLHAQAAIRRLRAARSPEGYLVVVIRNQILDVVRRMEARRVEQSSVAWVEQEYSEPPLSTEELLALQRVLDELPEEDLELLRMKFWDGFSIREIAGRLGIGYSAAGQRLFRLLHRLRDQMQP